MKTKEISCKPWLNSSKRNYTSESQTKIYLLIFSPKAFVHIPVSHLLLQIEHCSRIPKTFLFIYICTFRRKLDERFFFLLIESIETLLVYFWVTLLSAWHQASPKGAKKEKDLLFIKTKEIHFPFSFPPKVPEPILWSLLNHLNNSIGSARDIFVLFLGCVTRGKSRLQHILSLTSTRRLELNQIPTS